MSCPPTVEPDEEALRQKLAVLHTKGSTVCSLHLFVSVYLTPAVEPDQEALRQKLGAARDMLARVQVPKELKLKIRWVLEGC